MAKTLSLITQKEIINSKAVCNTIGVVLFIALTALGGYIRIPLPFTPVPITLQTLFVILAGALLGTRLGAASQVGYMALGLAGLPIFQSYGSGFVHLAGPTGGYLAGFIIAPLIVGRLISLRKNTVTFGWVACAMALGSATILLLGTIRLTHFLDIGIGKGFVLGALYFIPGDFIKILAATFLYLALNKQARALFKIDDER
jgi:biotin transport system substrate-specific component